MTEKELTKFEEEYNVNEQLPKDLELEFFQEGLEANIKEKFKLNALYLMYKKIRDDEQVEKIKKGIKKLSDIIEYQQDRIKELGG